MGSAKEVGVPGAVATGDSKAFTSGKIYLQWLKLNLWIRSKRQMISAKSIRGH